MRMRAESVPLGMVFDPTEVDIVSYYLPRLLASNWDVTAVLGEDFSPLIKVANVYSCNPSFFFSNDQSHPMVRGNKFRFVLSPREKIAQNSNVGKRPKRGVTVHGSGDGGGFWRSSTGDRAVSDGKGRVIGFSNMLNYFEYSDNNGGDAKKKSNKDGTSKKTSWIMYEYRLAGDSFQEWVICKIKDRRQTNEYHQYQQDDEGSEEQRKLMEAKAAELIEDTDGIMEVDEERLGLIMKELEEII